MNWINNARVLAVLAVVCLHAAAGVVTKISDWHSGIWWEGNLFDAATRWCVPVLVMVSGALLLNPDRREDTSTFYKKRIARVLAPLLFWSAFYLCWRYLKGWYRNTPPTTRELLDSILKGEPYFHLWFLYMITGLYLLTPIIRLVLQQIDRTKLIWVMTTLFLLNGANSAVTILLQLELGFPLHGFISYLPYFVAGHLIATTVWQPKSWKLSLALVCTISATAVGCYLCSITLGLTRGLYFYNYLSITVVPMSLCIMLLFKKHSTLLPRNSAHILSSLSLGIYLVHPVALELIEHLIAATDYPTFMAIPCTTLFAYSVTAILCWLISRVPLLNRMI
ncbi:acyltransferase family protein [Duganella fentianensis]|uniref:acyltransferase n=1 Tax=Duganella fentianensis TaxID=2692177 RepID=UPI0032B2A748